MNATQAQTDAALEEENAMNSTETEILLRQLDPRRRRSLGAGWLSEAAGAAAAVILSIIGLAGVSSTNLAAIAAITLGASFLFEATGLVSCLDQSFGGMRDAGERLEWVGTVVGKTLGGICGILVGMLVILHATAPTLLPVAVLIFGATFLFTSMVSMVPGTQEITGAVAFVLGLLAITGVHSISLALIALLGVGVVTVINGAASKQKITASGRYEPAVP
jgi:hypothetical protein